LSSAFEIREVAARRGILKRCSVPISAAHLASAWYFYCMLFLTLIKAKLVAMDFCLARKCMVGRTDRCRIAIQPDTVVQGVVTLSRDCGRESFLVPGICTPREGSCSPCHPAVFSRWYGASDAKGPLQVNLKERNKRRGYSQEAAL